MSKITGINNDAEYNKVFSVIDTMVRRYEIEKGPEYAVAVIGALICTYCDITHQSTDYISKLIFNTIQDVINEQDDSPLEESEDDE